MINRLRGTPPLVKRHDANTLYCFSPPVMIATFAIETCLAFYAFWRYKTSQVTRMSIILFGALATFQLAEFMVCRGLGGDGLIWSRVGYIAITILPPVGLHLLAIITKDRRSLLIWPGYIAGAAFIAFFSLIGHSIDGHACLGNYVIFQVAPGFGWLYGLYYYGLLVAALVTGWYYLRQPIARRVRRAVTGLVLGYTIFIIPATTVNLLDVGTVAGIPSIMCGFAVLLALCLAFIVLPVTATKRGA
jgi:hypothetical protein